MCLVRKAIVVASSLFLTIACDQSDMATKSMETKQAYSLCPKTDGARQRLYEQVRDFAKQQRARLIDRGAGAQGELSSMGSNVLNDTGGEVILLTIERYNKFRVTVTNLGLREKIAVSVAWRETEDFNAVDSFMRDLGRFWTVQRVDGGVTNDPPC